MQVDAQGDGGQEPAGDADGGAGSEPSPALVFDVWREVVDDGEEQDKHGDGDDVEEDVEGDAEREAEVGVCDVEAYEVRGEAAGEKAGQGGADDQGEQNGDEHGGAAGLPVRAGFADFIDGVERVLNG